MIYFINTHHTASYDSKEIIHKLMIIIIITYEDLHEIQKYSFQNKYIVISNEVILL